MTQLIGYILGIALIVLVGIWYIKYGDDDAL